MFIDHTNRRVLDVIEGRGEHSIVNYLRESKEPLVGQREEVTCDTWDAYVDATREVFGDEVRVTIDRFHVMKNFQEHLTESCREIQRGLAKEEAKEQKGTRWLWQTNPENLCDEQRQKLEQLRKRFPRLKRLIEQRESLRGIFEDTTIKDAAEGEQRLRGWMGRAVAMGPKGLATFCKTLGNGWPR